MRKDIIEALQRRFDDAPFDEYVEFARSIGASIQSNDWTDAERKEHNFNYLCERADTYPEWKTKLCRALGLPPPDEQQTALMQESLEIAKRSAEAAERSASASEQSASHSRSSKSAAWIAVLVSAAALAVSLFWSGGE